MPFDERPASLSSPHPTYDCLVEGCLGGSFHSRHVLIEHFRAAHRGDHEADYYAVLQVVHCDRCGYLEREESPSMTASLIRSPPSFPSPT